MLSVFDITVEDWWKKILEGVDRYICWSTFTQIQMNLRLQSFPTIHSMSKPNRTTETSKFGYLNIYIFNLSQLRSYLHYLYCQVIIKIIIRWERNSWKSKQLNTKVKQHKKRKKLVWYHLFFVIWGEHKINYLRKKTNHPKY